MGAGGGVLWREEESDDGSKQNVCMTMTDRCSSENESENLEWSGWTQVSGCFVTAARMNGDESCCDV